MLFHFEPSPRSHVFVPQIYPREHKSGNYGLFVTKTATHTMKAEIDGPAAPISERTDAMYPPASPRKQGVTTSPSSYSKQLDPQGGKRRQSRFDPMGSDADEEGYGDLGHRHTFRKISEDEKTPSFSLPGIKSLLNPSSEREQAATLSSSASASTPSYQSPSLPSLTSNSPGGSPSTVRSSRYSSLASGSSLGDIHNGWWAPTFERNNSHSSAARASPIPHSLFATDDSDAKRRRSDQSPVVRDLEEQTRLKYMGQSRNASLPTPHTGFGTASGSSSPRHELRLMHPPAAPHATAARGSVSYSDAIPQERRPSAVPRASSLVSGPLSRSFADLSANERDRERERERQGSSVGPDRRGSSISIAEIQRQRAHTATPPESFRSQTNTPGPISPRLQNQTHRSSLSDLIKAQSGDNVNMASGRYESQPMEKPLLSEPGPTAWLPSRRSSTSSTRSASTPMTVNLNSDDGYSHSRPRPYPYPGPHAHGHGHDSMSGMDVLAESARRVSEEEEHRRGANFPEDPEDSPRPGQVGPKYQCAYCTKTFSRPSSLRIHTYSHTGERPFVCQEPSCGRRFSVQSNLKRHAKVHQLGQAGGASLHQLHPAPGQGMHLPPPSGHGYYASQGGYGYDNHYPTAPYAQPHPPSHEHAQSGPHGQGQSQRPYDPRFEEEDELDEDEMDEDVSKQY